MDLSRPDLITSFGVVALIDLETRLPVQVQTDGIIRSFQFMDPPDQLSLPSDLKAQLKKGDENRSKLDLR